MVEAYRCNNCTEYLSGRPAGHIDINPTDRPEQHEADLCGGCYESLLDQFNLSEGTVDL